MLHLVESPPGHLSGSIVISSLNRDGSRKDESCDVTGSIAESNVELEAECGTLEHWLKVSRNVIGTLHGDTLTLTVGNGTEQFQRMSQKDYTTALANLDMVGQHIAMFNAARKAVEESEAYGRELNADLKTYIAWGQERIAHVPEVRLWYADRLNQYTKCLQTVRPLAASGVPSWRWQDCVLTIHNDEYERTTEAGSIREADSKNQQDVASLKAQINTAERRFPTALKAMSAVCGYAKDPVVCAKDVQRLNALSPHGFLDEKLVTTFRAIVPQVGAAVGAEAEVSSSGEPKLSSIDHDLWRLYDSPR